jgi:hypothetical protein
MIFLSVPAAYACRGGNPYEAYYHMNLDEKFFFKAHFILKHQLELGLSDDQVKSIVALKMEAKKYLIKQDAEIEVLKIDIMGKLGEEKLDKEAIGQLIDKKFELKKAKAKYFLDAYATLKGTLTEDQKKAGKAIWLKKFKD